MTIQLWMFTGYLEFPRQKERSKMPRQRPSSRKSTNQRSMTWKTETKTRLLMNYQPPKQKNARFWREFPQNVTLNFDFPPQKKWEVPFFMTQKVKDLRGNFLLKNRAFHFNSNSANNSTTRSAFSTRRSFRWSAMATWWSANNKVSKDKKPWHYSLWVFLQKIGGKTPKMDGL